MLKEVRRLLGVINYFEWGFDIVESDDGKIMMLIIFHNEVFDLHVEENASDEERKQIEDVIKCICEDTGMEVDDIPDGASDVYIEFVDMAIKNKFTLSVLTADEMDNECCMFGMSSEDMMIELIDKVK